MPNSIRNKFLTIFSSIILVCVCAGQTRLTYPQTNSSSAVAGADCVKNPAQPGCGAAQEQEKMPGTTSTLPGPVQIPSSDRGYNPKLQDRTTAQFPIPFPKEEPTDFQQFVKTSVGRELPIFGHDLFEEVPSTFAPADRIPVTADYVIGPGDELLIRAWGQIEMDARVVVDRSGAIFLPRVGSINVAGVQYEQLTNVLKENIGRVFRNFDLTVSLGQLRSIQVFVVGQARRPGAYTISSLSTLVNALFASGGPNNHGSMRHILVKRNGTVATEFDLYDLLLKGDKSKDIVLQPGDVIYIPPAGPQVAMFGSVTVPAIYELSGPTSLEAQLQAAGGLTNTADGSRAIVERIDHHSARRVDEFALDEQGMKRDLHDGDVVRIFPIIPRFENAVTLRGNVAQPGRYPWREGMRIRDLIPNREFLLTRAFWDQQNLAAADKTFGKTEEELNRRTSQSVETSNSHDNRVRALSSDILADNSREEAKTEELKNDVKRNAPEINWEYAVIQRLDPVSLTTSLIPFNLGKAILDDDPSENKLLRPGDIVTIFSQADISVGLEKQSKFVRLEGEFNAPGIYKVKPGETLRELVQRAGGLSSKAYLFAAEFTRESVRKEQQRSLDEMIRNLEQELQRTMAAAASRPEQQNNIVAESRNDQEFIQKLRAVKPSGRIVLELPPGATDAAQLPDLPLEDGDRFMVPFKSSTVTVVGAVYNQSSFLFRDRTPIKRYLALAGNGTRIADSKRMFILRADGSVVSREQAGSIWRGGFGSIQSLPGDMLVVPTQLERGAVLRGLKDWSQVISQFGLGVAAIGVFMK